MHADRRPIAHLAAPAGANRLAGGDLLLHRLCRRNLKKSLLASACLNAGGGQFQTRVVVLEVRAQEGKGGRGDDVRGRRRCAEGAATAALRLLVSRSVTRVLRPIPTPWSPAVPRRLPRIALKSNYFGLRTARLSQPNLNGSVRSKFSTFDAFEGHIANCWVPRTTIPSRPPVASWAGGSE